MFVVEGVFKYTLSHDTEQVLETIDLLLGALRMNGQILGREYPEQLMEKKSEPFFLYLKRILWMRAEQTIMC